jgi:RHH-type rel operon transcriptional repressor/antitoxin RelB
MLAIRLPEDIEHQLDALVRKTGRSKDWYVGEAIRSYLEDMEDYDLAAEAVARDEPTIFLEELERRLSLKG